MDKPVIKIKYFDEKYGTKLPRLAKIKQGDWIDVYAAKTICFHVGERAIIPLGIAMELPEGYEAYVLPRSSTAKKFGIIMANSMGIIDNSYCGDNDEWGFVAYCIGGDGDNKYRNLITNDDGSVRESEDLYFVNAGDRIGQFRIQKKMEDIEFEEVEHLNNEDRGGFGSTGTR